MKAAAIFQSYEQNILQGATIRSSIAPITGYDRDSLGFLRPDFHVAWSSGSVIVTWELLQGGSPATPARGDILVIPASNGETGHMTWTNDDGLSVALASPGLYGRWPKSLVKDLSVAQPNATTRTSAAWHLVVSANSVDFVLGGGVALYSPKTYLVDRDFQWSYSEWEEGDSLDAENNFGTRFSQNLDTLRRGVDLSTIATDDDLDRIRDWFRGNGGRARPGFLWFNPDVNDGYLGRFAASRLSVVKLFDDANQVTFSFEELSKGRPLS